ncbi:MAG: TRAP transporter small permease subunit [Sedimenticola sp.]|uniref:TRAP transporter small permease protein n=1 Tax=Sedimenticola thiotaurini TaxID=1543721 RepID=A0A558CPH1_9GAMM|nr:TRAP transporter small permease subunit [Sedimenticola sp.]MCW8975264.1 TRAP transporter small permease subunit [Sedimenticola sp.]TVT50663.1 MAG: TRAP transporter small permease subunit [Sedimenticola thiotaurini]
MNQPNALEYRIPIVDALNGFVQRIGHIMAWANVLLIGIILVQVVLRYGFNNGLVYLEELIWHIYAVGFMFGLSFAITNDSHIRVDIIHMNLSRENQHRWEIFGILVLLLPFIMVIFFHSVEWVYYSYEIGESSANPTGLPYRWIVKSVIPLSFALLFIAAIARLIREITLLLHLAKEPEEPYPGRVSMLRHLFRVQELTVKDDTNTTHHEEK